MQVVRSKVNGIDTEALARTMDKVRHDHAEGVVRFSVNTAWKGGTRSESRVRGYELGRNRHTRDFKITIDEPQELLGANTAANPQEYLLSAMNACMVVGYVAICAMQGIELERLEIETRGELDLRGFLGLDKDVKPGYDALHYIIRVKGSATPEQFAEVHRAVMATSPNYNNMAQPIRMLPELIVE